MEKSDKQEQRKNKFTEVKTFTVPFASGEIKENISIPTNSINKTSKEKIINQAFKFNANLSDRDIRQITANAQGMTTYQYESFLKEIGIEY